MTPLVHPRTQKQLAAIAPSWSGSYIFHGDQGVGKATAALAVARRLNCQGDESATCAACRQFDAGAYPDLVRVQPEDKPSITIEQIRTLVQALSLRLYYANGLRIVIIDDAQQLTAEAQNALLKLIEEPPTQTLFILVTARLEALLPTVRSRCSHIYFARPAESELAEYLAAARQLRPVDAVRLAAASESLPGLAITLAEQPEAATARQALDDLAASAPSLSAFERLLAAKRLIDDKSDLAHFGRRLQAAVMSRLRAGQLEPTIAATQLQALERFRHHLGAKVAPRVALERLMLEL